MSRELAKALAPLARRIRLIAARAVVTLVDDANGMQTAQARLLAGEVRERIDRFQQYGFTSVPHSGAEGVYLSLGGERDHGVLVLVGDRRFRLTGLAGGEVALHDDLGHRVHLTRDGIVIDGAEQPVIFTNTPKVRFETSLVECTGEIRDRCDADGLTMESMRQVYNDHTHLENDSGGPTNPPQEGM